MVLKLVPPAAPPKPSTRRKVADMLLTKTPAYMLVCQRCASMEFIETVTGVEVTKDGKRRRGTKTLICLHCMIRGERVEPK